MNDQRRAPRMPWWMKLLIVLAMLPVVALPMMLGAARPEALDNKALIWIYPFYVVVAGVLPWNCYGRRTEMTWILLVLMMLTHGAMYVMLTMPTLE